MRRSHCSILLAMLALLSCSREKQRHEAATGSRSAAGNLLTPSDTTPPKTLSGTQWRLVEIQSPGGKQAETRPDPAKYTMDFDDEGGFVVMRLDCHTVKGNYEDRRSADQRSGTLTMGPLNVTRVPCAKGSLADLVTREIGTVRSYRFANGRLSLDTSPGGAIYIWERRPSTD